MKKFNTAKNIQVVASEKFKNSIRSAVESTSANHNSYVRTRYDKSFIATIVTFNPSSHEVEYFSTYEFADYADYNRVNELIKEKISRISSQVEYSKNELVAVIKASDFEYYGHIGYADNLEQENRNMKIENKFMSLYIDIITQVNDNTTSIDELGLSIRSHNCLSRAGYTTVEEVKNASLDDMLRVRNLGYTSLSEIENVLNIKFI